MLTTVRCHCGLWERNYRMPKKLITIIGANGVGKTTTSEVLLQLCKHSAYVDADWCRAINPFQFTEATKKTVTDNIFCLFRNYLLCDDIETVIFPYGFHGERKEIYDEVIHRLREEAISFEEHIVILKCEYEENKRRSIKDNRGSERVERGMRNTFYFYDDFEYPEIDTTSLSPEQVAKKILEMFCR